MMEAPSIAEGEGTPISPSAKTPPSPQVQASISHQVIEVQQHQWSSERTSPDSDVQSDEHTPEVTNEGSDNQYQQAPAEVDSFFQPSTAQSSRRSRRPWNPIWLSKYVLLSLTSIFTLSVLALILLWVLSKRDHGFRLLTNNHYVWTYAPTAVLTILVSLWSQVQFWCMLLTPWQRLQHGNMTARFSLLLDYISPILPTALSKAIKLRESAVVITIVCSLLLKLVIVASTGLLVPVATQLADQNYELTTETTFRAPRSWDSDSQKESEIMYETYATLALGLPYSEGLKDNVLYQTIRAPAAVNTTDAIVSATVDALYPLIRCESAQFVPSSASEKLSGEWHTNLTMSVSWSSCPRTLASPLSTWVFINDPAQNPVPQHQVYGQRNPDLMTCLDKPEVFWQAFTVVEAWFNKSMVADATLRNHTYNDTGIWGVQIMPIKGIMCSIDYALEKAKVSYDYAGETPDIIVDGPTTHTGNHLQGLNHSSFLTYYPGDSEGTGLMLGNDVTGALDEDYPNDFFGIMSKVANASYMDFMRNESLLIEAAIRVSNASMVHVASYRLGVNESTPVDGQISLSATRLHVSQLPLWLMVAGLSITSILSVLLIWCRPSDVVPCNTATIGGVALIVAHSSRLRDLLQGTGRMRLSSIRQILTSYMFRSKGHSSLSDTPFSIEPVTMRENVQSDFWEEVWQRALKRPTKWWRPLPLRPLVFAIISSLPLALIAVLEILQRLSAREGGIATAPGSENIKTLIVTRLVPSLVMVLMAVLYDSVCFNISLYAPFQRLKKGNVTMQHSLVSAVVGKIPPHAVYLSIRHKHWAAAVANTAVIVASILTIAASGLYVVDSTPGATSIKLQRNDFFNLTWADSLADDGGAAVITTDLEYLNLSYPLWTFDEIALPALQVSAASVKSFNKTQDKQSTLKTRVPAFRASLNCTAASENEYSVKFSQDARAGDTGKLYINASTKLPPDCQYGGQLGTGSRLEWSSIFQFLDFSSWVGTMTDLHVGPLGNDFLSSGEANSALQKDNPPGCPSLGFTFGNFSQNNGFFDSAPSNFTILTCYQLMTEIQTDLEVMLPNWTVISAVSDESTVKYLPSDANARTTFQYRPQFHLDFEMIGFNYSDVSSGLPSTATVVQDQVNSYYWIDSFFAIMLYGKHGIDPAELWGPLNHDRLVSAIQTLYRRYMAQVASHKMRTIVPAGAPSSRSDGLYSATWLNPDRNNVRQSNTSKIVLQVALGVMFLCGIVSFWLLDAEETLPHNPCSIAGIASLVADSEICSDTSVTFFPPQVERMTESELRKNGIWRNQTFRMGWWNGGEGQARRFGIDVTRPGGQAISEDRDIRSGLPKTFFASSFFTSRVK